jgi:hypothetical protein
MQSQPLSMKVGTYHFAHVLSPKYDIHAYMAPHFLEVRFGTCVESWVKQKGRSNSQQVLWFFFFHKLIKIWFWWFLEAQKVGLCLHVVTFKWTGGVFIHDMWWFLRTPDKCWNNILIGLWSNPHLAQHITKKWKYVTVIRYLWCVFECRSLYEFKSPCNPNYIYAWQFQLEKCIWGMGLF